MTMRAFVPLLAACLALCACQKHPTEASASATGGGGGGLMHDLQSEMLGSSKSTRQGVALDVYFDVSGSSTNLKKPLGELLKRVVDTYPDAVPYTYSFYGKDCYVQDTGVSNVQSLNRAAKAWSNSKLVDKTTNLGEAFRRILARAEGDPKTDFAAVIVSDGGYEDPEGAQVEFRKLQGCQNLRMLTFVGVHTGDNPKLQRLADLTKSPSGEPGGLEVHLVTDANNDESVTEASDALKKLVASARKVD